VIYSVRHLTSFSYEPGVRESVMEARMQPRSEGRQRCLSFSLEVAPDANIMLYRDFLGNSVHHFDIPGRHSRVDLTAQALVEIQDAPAPQASEAGSWQDLETLIATGDYWETLAPSHYAHPAEPLEKFSSELRLERGDNPFEFLLQLNDAMYRAFEYVPNSTAVDSPIGDALRTRQGVCQDFAHIMIALLREFRVPSRYVSGYLAHGGEKKDRSPDGATHAWVDAFLPGLGWVAFDPANNLVGGDRHIRVAIGRDYADVPPTRGVYKGKAKSGLSVSVTVTSSNAPQPEELFPVTVVRSVSSSLDDLQKLYYEQQQQQQ
jgi:transglutaminase-like putative cysteine protease